MVGAVDANAARLGGVASIQDEGIHAFSYPSPTLTATERRAFAVGNSFFKDNWIQAPASAAGRDGLGPLFNARSCSACHLRDGRGRPPRADDVEPTGFLLRIGVVPDESGSPSGPDRPHSAYGDQLQEHAIPGVAPELSFRVETEAVPGRYGDGAPYTLERPRYVFTDEGYGELGEAARIGARVAPQMIGLGLLEGIPMDALVARADPDDRDGDRISGRPHWVVSARTGVRALGRFGWRATQPTVEEQVASAFVQDIGITSSLFPSEALATDQVEHITFASGGEPELDGHKLQRVTFYSQVIAVPEQRSPDDPAVRRGRALFDRSGCADCHVPTWTTGASVAHAPFRGQVIHPYTDLLLHDLGSGLADEKHDGDAAPSEWRTPPLWGIGLFEVVSGHTRYLHDGRARDLAEAILWHGGEAEPAREAFRTLASDDRAALLAFLRSL